MPPKTTKKKPVPPTSGSAKVSCCICCQSIQPDKDEALFCSGICQQWLHRYCASVSEDGYKSVKSGNSPFFCYCCYRVRKEEQLSLLESSIQALKAEILELKKCSSAVVPSPPSEDTSNLPQHFSAPSQQNYASVTVSNMGESAVHLTPDTHRTTEFHHDKKFNVVLYGVEECPPRTSKADRFESDLASVVSVLSTIDSNIQPQSIKDCYWLGKFSPQETRPRPILVRMIRISDVSKILSKKRLLSRPYSIKPDMSREQRLVEAVLLQERWHLIQSGVARNSIKIRNTRLFVKNKLHGQVINSKFQCEGSNLSSQSDTSYCSKNVADVVPIVVTESHQSGSNVPTLVADPNTSSGNLMNSNAHPLSPTPTSTIPTTSNSLVHSDSDVRSPHPHSLDYLLMSMYVC